MACRNSHRRWRATLGRRSFLRIGSAGLLGLNLADVLRREACAETPKQARTAKSVIMVWLAGGPATIDMWDMKPSAPEEIRGEFQPIDTSLPGVQICELLPQTAKLMHRCTLVRSLHHSIPAHGPGTQYMLTGNLPAAARDYPSLGSLAAKVLPAAPGVPAYVSFGRRDGAGFLGYAYNPFEIDQGADPRRQAREFSLPADFSAEELEDRVALRDRFDTRFDAAAQTGLTADLDDFQQQAFEILRSDRVRRALELQREPDAMRSRFGNTIFGHNALAARRLVEAGVRFVTIGLGGWDTHSANFRVLRTRLLPQLDQTLSALIGDLEERGLLESTIVYCAGEFGRTPRVNGAAGRDHWARSMAVLLAGGGLRRGHVHGSTDCEGTAPAELPCTPADLSATIFEALGIPAPQHVVIPSGRSVTMFPGGKPIQGVLV